MFKPLRNTMITLQNSKKKKYSTVWIIGMLKAGQENWVCGVQIASQKDLSLLASVKMGTVTKD